MWTNQLKRTLEDGQPAFVAQITEFPLADVAEYLALLGFDAVMIDGEHSGVDPLHARDMCRAVTAGGATPLVRVPYNDPNLTLGYLDAGAHGIIVPHSRTPADVAATVQACRYPPEGTRGAAAASRGSVYGTGPPPAETFAIANQEVMVIPLMEDVDAIENLDSILEVDGVDVFYIGPGDLALSMGRAYGDPEVTAVVENAITRVVAAGRVAATAATTPDQARWDLNLGATLITTQPFSLLRDAARDWLRNAKGG